MTGLKFLATAVAVVSLAGAGQSQVVEKKALTLDAAKRIAAAAAAEARRNYAGGAIAVVDDGGNLMYLERLDDTFAAGANISIGKARTAAMFKQPTRVFEEIIRNGRTSMVALPDFTPLQGGVPIEVDGMVVGGIGVSGAASAQQDEEIAMAGAAIVKSLAAAGGSAAAAAEVAHFAGRDVASAFAKGMPLLEVDGFKIHASRRDAAGMAEVHERDTDILYVLEGSAVLVTGGSVVDPQRTGPEEIRGPSIRDGVSRRLGKGDVVVVPNGTPHWFQSVQGPMTYYVVKVPAGCGGVQ
jgi:glc operon protein GlcG